MSFGDRCIFVSYLWFYIPRFLIYKNHSEVTFLRVSNLPKNFTTPLQLFTAKRGNQSLNQSLNQVRLAMFYGLS